GVKNQNGINHERTQPGLWPEPKRPHRLLVGGEGDFALHRKQEMTNAPTESGTDAKSVGRGGANDSSLWALQSGPIIASTETSSVGGGQTVASSISAKSSPPPR